MDASSIITSTFILNKQELQCQERFHSGTTATLFQQQYLPNTLYTATQPREQSADKVPLAATMQEFTTTANNSRPSAPWAAGNYVILLKQR
jgi:hypothetical protein